MKDIAILETNGFKCEVACFSKRINSVGLTWNIIVIFDDSTKQHGTKTEYIPILRDVDFRNNRDEQLSYWS